MRKSGWTLGLLLASVLVQGEAWAAQVTATWDGGGGSSNWGDAANWNPDGVPDNGTPAGTTYAVVIDDGGPGTGFLVGLNLDASIDSLSLGAGDTVGLGDGRILTVVQSGAGTGTILNAGIILLNGVSGASVTALRVSGGTVTLGGGGLVLMNGIGTYILGTAAPDRLVNADNTIVGLGEIGMGTMNFTNQGTLQVSDPGLSIDTADGVFVNTGTVEVAPGAALFVNGDSYVQTLGVTQVGGSLFTGAAFEIQAGVIIGTGVVAGFPVVSNSGQARPIGILFVGSSYTQTAAGSLTIRIGGPVPDSDYDRLEVNVAATLGGGLDVSLINGFVPAEGQVFTILTAASGVTGTFAGLPDGAPLPLPGGGGFVINYTATAVTLTWDSSIPVELMGFDVV